MRLLPLLAAAVAVSLTLACLTHLPESGRIHSAAVAPAATPSASSSTAISPYYQADPKRAVTLDTVVVRPDSNWLAKQIVAP